MLLGWSSAKDKSESGFTIEELARTAYRVYANCLDVPADWNAADKIFWMEVATRAMATVEYAMDLGETINYELFSKSLFGSLTKEIDVKWDALMAVQRFAWLAVGRHLINCMMIRDEFNLPDAEKYWPAWVKKQIGLIRGVRA